MRRLPLLILLLHCLGSAAISDDTTDEAPPKKTHRVLKKHKKKKVVKAEEDPSDLVASDDVPDKAPPKKKLKTVVKHQPMQRKITEQEETPLADPLSPATSAPPSSKSVPPATQLRRKGTKKVPPPIVQPKKIETYESRFYSSQLNTILGFGVARSSALVIGAQYGFAVSKVTPFYFGPEVNFALFSPGHALSVLAGCWYEWRVYGSPRLSIEAGALGGVAFTSALTGIGSTVPTAFLDLAIAQDVDELVTIRGQFRPGVISSIFAFQMNLNVAFRFL